MKWVLIFFLFALATPASAEDGRNTNLLPDAASASKPVPSYQPITASERGRWFLTSTIGPTSLLLAGPLSAAIGTARDIPSEYATHWDGFGKRMECA